MKTFQTKLIRFMYKKAMEIHRLIGVEPEKYFNEQDKKDLLGLEDSHALLVWVELVEGVCCMTLNQHKNISMDYTGLVPNTCPFCIIHGYSCTNCTYALNHNRECDNHRSSDFIPILQKMIKEGKYLNDEFYIQVVGLIVWEDGNENEPK